MNAVEIEKINDANFILKHFVNLSARLLPFLHELQSKRHPSAQDIKSKEKIINVYRNYSFDTSTSELLMDSNILELIKSSFDQLSTENYSHKESKHLNYFLNEYNRLKESWRISSSN